MLRGGGAGPSKRLPRPGSEPHPVAPGLSYSIRVWLKDRANEPEQHSRGRSLRKLAARLGLGLGAAGIAVVALLFVFGGEILNGFVKGKVERAFAKAHSGSTLRLGHLRYSVEANSLAAQSVTLNATNLTFKAGQTSLTGVRWGRLLWGKDGSG